MSPACQSLAALLRRHAGNWVDHSRIYEAAKHNASARVSDLRKLGFRISQRGAGERSEYRLDHDPFAVTYAQLACTVCDWRGDETKAIGGRCGRCGSATVQVEEPKQEALFA
jgi:hypothetical protein